MSDLISRQAAIKAVHDEFDECLVWDEGGECTANEVERVLEELPAIEPKHGKWLKIVDLDTVQCSECFEEFDYIDGLCYLCHGQELPDFCPQCGARMESE